MVLAEWPQSGPSGLHWASLVFHVLSKFSQWPLSSRRPMSNEERGWVACPTHSDHVADTILLIQKSAIWFKPWSPPVVSQSELSQIHSSGLGTYKTEHQTSRYGVHTKGSPSASPHSRGHLVLQVPTHPSSLTLSWSFSHHSGMCTEYLLRAGTVLGGTSPKWSAWSLHSLELTV